MSVHSVFRPFGFVPEARVPHDVVQTAVKIVIEPIFEADLDQSAYGYRPKRSGTDAIRQVHRLVCRGYSDVVDADLSKYFDTIPHAQLMQSVARRIVDGQVLRLIKLWLVVAKHASGMTFRSRNGMATGHGA